MVIAFAVAVLMNVGSYWFSDKIVLRMYHAQEVGADHPLSRMVARLAHARAAADAQGVRDSGRSRPIAFAHGPQPAARAVAGDGRHPSPAVRTPELEGVIAHELAHVKHRDILISSVAATIAAADHVQRSIRAMFGGFRRIARRPRRESAGACWRWRFSRRGRDADSGRDSRGSASSRPIAAAPRSRRRRSGPGAGAAPHRMPA
jgi:Zn-dependent protease with chaperone function